MTENSIINICLFIYKKFDVFIVFSWPVFQMMLSLFQQPLNYSYRTRSNSHPSSSKWHTRWTHRHTDSFHSQCGWRHV